MKNSLLIFLIAIVQVSASVNIHGQNLTLMAEGNTVREVFKQIENETNYRFFYNDEFRDLSRPLSFEMRDYHISEVLDMMLANSDVTYRILDNNVIVITPHNSQGQDIQITGVITDVTTGEPLPGASVVVRGTTTGTIAGIDGGYSVSVPNRDVVLVFSFVGYNTQEIAVGENNIINVELSEDIRLLDEIVVVGYGTQTRANVIGSVSTVRSEELTSAPVSRVSNALAGRLPGAIVQQRSLSQLFNYPNFCFKYYIFKALRLKSWDNI